MLCFSPWIYAVISVSRGQGLAQNIGWATRPRLSDLAQLFTLLNEPFYFRQSSIDLYSPWVGVLTIVLFGLPLLVLLFFKVFSARAANRRMSAYFEEHGIGWGLIRPGTELSGFVFTTLDEGSKRRSIYFTVKRSKILPMMQVFDAPDALVSLGERPTTTIAPQALMLLNNPNVRTYAKSFALRIAPDAKTSFEDAVNAGYVTAIARPPSAEEFAESVAVVKAQAGAPEGPAGR